MGHYEKDKATNGVLSRDGTPLFTPQTVRENLKSQARALRSTGLSQAQIGTALGVPQQTISRWLNL